MNSNVEDYLQSVVAGSSRALESGNICLSHALPCFVCRELEAPKNRFVDSSDPFIISYRALRRIQRLARPSIPRKLEFESAVYLKEGIIDSIFPNSLVTLLFVGDGASDMRFSYNCYRLLKTFGDRFRVFCFICNQDLIGTQFGNQSIVPNWSTTPFGDRLFYHAEEWAELSTFQELAKSETSDDRRVLAIVDIDGTFLCPRPKYHNRIKDVRKRAITLLCAEVFDDSVFSGNAPGEVSRIHDCYAAASRTGFSKAYDDEDLTMLIALGLYAGIISEDDPLLNPLHDIGFVVPVEWLQYASFLIGNNAATEYRFRQLRSLYIRCIDAIQDGSPTAFVDFRRKEEQVLIEGAQDQTIVASREVVSFIYECATVQAVPIAFSDRPNASLGLSSTGDTARTAQASETAFVNTPLALV